MFAPPQEIDRLVPSNLRADLRTSTLSLASNSQLPRPLPILQHLFWGDRSVAFNDRYGSEGCLDDMSPSRGNHLNQHNSRRPSSSTANSTRRRRYRSCTSPPSDAASEEEFQSLPRYLRQLRDSDSPRGNMANGYIPNTMDFNSLPRYIRQLEKPIGCSSEDVASFRSDRAITSSESCSRPPTTSESFTSSLAEEEATLREEEIVDNKSRHTNGGIKSHFTMDELRMIDETDTETVDTCRELVEEEAEKVSYAALLARRNNGEPRVTINLETNNGLLVDKITNSDRTPTPYPPDSERASSCQSQTSENSARESVTKPPRDPSRSKVPAIEFSAPQSSRAKQRSTSVITTSHQRNAGQRRFSAFAQEFPTDRGRSISPSFEHYQHRSLRGFTAAANREFLFATC
uniref:Uncharacterized protein n=1 Tax=Caenorhabditis japonica TaxID=281687 RepID=A0A8R1E500_CAEJA